MSRATPNPLLKQRIKNYGVEFKLKAVQLSDQPGVLVKDVAESLDIHPFMLSKWRKQVRDGELVGKPPQHRGLLPVPWSLELSFLCAIRAVSPASLGKTMRWGLHVSAILV